MAPKMDPEVKAKMKVAFRAMASITVEDVLHDMRPFLVVFKDGRVQRFFGIETVPAAADPITCVDSKDILISPETGVILRLYKPPNLNPLEKVPLLVYFHGGGICIESVSSPAYHLYLNTMSSQANAIIVSVDYRRGPENPVPVAYDDSWSAIDWIAAGEDPWLKDYADYSRVFFGGDSAGANIAHHMAIRFGKEPLIGMRLNGIVLIHPFFWGENRIGSEEEKIKNGAFTGTAGRMWKFACPKTNGMDDPMINPAKDPDLVKLGGDRVLVLVAEQDALRDRGFYYEEAVMKCGWNWVVEVVETAEEDHVFHLMNPNSATADELMSQVVAFLNSTTTAGE